MDYRNILVFVVIGCLLVVGRVSAYYNQTYGSYSFILSNVMADNSQGKTSLTNAQDWCRSNGYTLAAIPNKEVQGYIKQFISSAISNGLMSSMDLILLNGKLYTTLPGIWIWVNGQQTNGGVEIKDQLDISQHYFYGFLKTTDYKLHVSTHNNGRPFICEKPGNVNDCAGGLSLNGRCYERKTNDLTWYSARNECLDGGGDLASFETLSDSTFRSTLGSTLLANASATEYWVGIQRAEWRWEDTGLAIKYTSWEGGSPSNAYECLCLRVTPGTSQLSWYTFDCSFTYRFICTATTATTSNVYKDSPSTKTLSGSHQSTPSSISSTSSSVPNASTTLVLSQSSNNEGLSFGQGVGVGVGIGLAVLVIVLVIIFIIVRQYLNKRRQNDAKRESSAVQASTHQQTSTFSTAALTSNQPNKNSSPKNENHLGRTTANTEDPYETLQSTDARSPESPYQQLDK